MAIKTVNSAVSRALDFVHRTDIYFAIGKTSPWSDESNPPQPIETDTLQELIGYRKVDTQYLVVPYDNRTLGQNDILITLSDGTKWLVISEANAYTERARYVYISTTILPTDLPTGDYRQVGVFTGVVPQDGITKPNLLPSEVQKPGVLEVLDNRVKSTRTNTTKETLSFIIQF